MEKPATSPLARLPIEILHMVFAHLKPQDVAQIRLTRRLLADIGLHHLISEVHLIFKSSSFERMRQISLNPVVSSTVKSLFYEAEVIQRCHDFNDWQTCVENSAVLADMAAAPPPERKSSTFLRRWQIFESSPQPARSMKELRRAYAHYSQCAANQQMIRRHDRSSDLIQDAMSRFPNLDTIQIFRERQFFDCSRYLVREFEAGLFIPHGRLPSQDACGVSQLLSVLLGAISTGRRLRRVTCDQVHWTFFSLGVNVLAKTRRAVEHLTFLQLKISTCHEDDDNNDHSMCASSRACTECLQHGALRGFIAAAPHLRDLNIGLNPVYGHLPPISLADAVGTHHWLYLERVTFAYLSVREQDLLDFCNRHATNLTHLSIVGLTLTSGCWQRVFQQIRRALRLRTVEVSEWLIFYDDEDWFNLIGLGEEGLSEEARKPRLRVAIEAYILVGGDAEPLNLDPTLYESDDNDYGSDLMSSGADADLLDGFDPNLENGWGSNQDGIDHLEEDYYASLNDDYGSI